MQLVLETPNRGLVDCWNLGQWNLISSEQSQLEKGNLG